MARFSVRIGGRSTEYEQIRRDELKRRLAEDEEDIRRDNYDRTLELVEKMSAVREDMSEAEKTRFDQSDNVKGLTKAVKEYTPELWNDESQQILWIPKVEAGARKFERLVGSIMEEKKKTGQPLSQSDAMIVAIYNKVGADEVARYVEELTKSNPNVPAEENWKRGLYEIGKAISGFFKGKKSKFSSGLTEDESVSSIFEGTI